MGVITDCHGLPEDDDRQAEVRSAHKLLLSLGGFDDMFEVLAALLHKTAYRCHIKFGTDMLSHGVSFTKAKKSKCTGKFSIKSKAINRKQSFEDDYSIAVGIAWQIRDLLLHEDTRKAILRSQTLEMSFVALKMISEASIVHCGHYEYIDTSPVLAYMALTLQMTLHNVCTRSILNNGAKKTNKVDSSTPLSETILEETTGHVFSCLEKLFGVEDTSKNEKTYSDNLQSTTKTAQNPTRRHRLSPTGDCSPSKKESVNNEPQGTLCKVKVLTAVLKFMADATAMCSATHYHGLFIDYTSRCVQHIRLLLEQLYCDQIKFKEEDLKDAILCLKSSFSYAAKLLNLVLTDSIESSTVPPKAFDLANDLLDLIISIESYLGSGYASRLVAAAKPWLPDLVLALGSGNILKHAEGDEKYSIPSAQMKFHFPKWPLIVAKTELSEVNEVRNEEDGNCSQTEKFSAFNRLMAMVIILLKGNSHIMDAVGVIFLTFSLVGLERKEFELSLGLLHFVCFKLFDHDDRNWGDMMLSALQEIYPKIEREIAEESHEDEHKDLHRSKELLEPLWMYHLYETGRVSMTDE